MAITMPTVFAQNHLRSGVSNDMFVMIWDSGARWYGASTRDMTISARHIYPHLISVSGIKEKLDLHRKTWGTSAVTIKLLNPRYMPAGSGVRGRLSEGTEPIDLLKVSDWAIVYIYLVAGENMTSLTSDTLLRFKGRIVGTPEVTEKYITVKVISQEKERHKMLPDTTVSSVYSSASAENLGKRIPLVYGEFNQNFWGDQVYADGSYTGTGLAKALRVDASEEPKYVISDHVLNAGSTIFFDMNTIMPFEAANNTITLNDSARGTAQVTKSGNVISINQSYRLNDSPPSDYTDYTKVATSSANAHDGDTGTKAAIIDNVSDTGYGVGTLQGLALWGVDNQEALKEAILDVSFGDNIPTLYVYFYAITQEIPAGSLNSTDARLYYRVANTYVTKSIVSWVDAASWHSGRLCDRNDLTLDGSSAMADFTLGIFAYYTDSGDGTLNNQNLLKVGEMYLLSAATTDTVPSVTWADCKGREYGSWITASGRSIDGQASGDMIENPAHIVESILRDELSLSSEIDTSSFDDAYDSGTALANRQARLNLTELESSESVIRKIAEQSTFAFTWTAAGKAKLIPLHSSYWSSKTIDSTIHWSQIKANSLKISKTKIFCNELEVRSRWHGESGLFRDTDTTTDSTSQTNYGAWRRTANWKALVGSARSHVASHYVNGTDGLWSQPHLQVELETLGFTNAQLEIGDAIELDSVSCDPQLKAYDATWSGIKLCVTELDQTLNGTKIKAVELF